MFSATSPDFLPRYDIFLARTAGKRGYSGGISTARGLRNPKRLQSEIPSCDLWQEIFFLFGATVPQERAHCVHLSMARSAISA